MTTLARRSLDGGLRALTSGMGMLLGARRRAQVLAHVVESLVPAVAVETPLGRLTLHCPGELTVFRATTFLSKEPETIEWIDTFRQDDVFWDIGANVGLYSLYAALKPGRRRDSSRTSAFKHLPAILAV